MLRVALAELIAVRAKLLAWSGSRFAGVPDVADTRRYYQHLSRFSAAFTIVSDTAMGTLGGSLKRREKLSGRLADALAYLYLASASLKRYHDGPKTRPNHALARWSVELCLYRIQEALVELKRGRTTLVIAHRLSTVEHADEIIVMEDGRIVERGSHAVLASRDGAYAGLKRAEFRS